MSEAPPTVSEAGSSDGATGSPWDSNPAPAEDAPLAPPSPTVAWEQGAGRSLEVPGAPGFVFASMLARFVAYVIDGLIVVLLYLIPLVALEAVMSGESNLKLFLTAIVSTVVSFAYYIGSWRSGRRATLGQRLVKIQVGNAFDGRTLTFEQATSRWFALAFPFQAIAVIPALAQPVSGLLLLWAVVLLFATAVSATRQGPHDRFARSAVVQRAGAGSSGLVLGCLLVIVIIAALAAASIAALYLLGDQMEEILRQIGESV